MCLNITGPDNYINRKQSMWSRIASHRVCKTRIRGLECLIRNDLNIIKYLAMCERIVQVVISLKSKSGFETEFFPIRFRGHESNSTISARCQSLALERSYSVVLWCVSASLIMGRVSVFVTVGWLRGSRLGPSRHFSFSRRSRYNPTLG
jgi:hypothetical protein